MNDDDLTYIDREKEQKDIDKAKTDEASQKAVHIAADIAIGYFGTPAAAALYDKLGESKYVKGLENLVGKTLNPSVRMTNKALADAGLLDAAGTAASLLVSKGKGGNASKAADTAANAADTAANAADTAANAADNAANAADNAAKAADKLQNADKNANKVNENSDLKNNVPKNQKNDGQVNQVNPNLNENVEAEVDIDGDSPAIKGDKNLISAVFDFIIDSVLGIVLLITAFAFGLIILIVIGFSMFLAFLFTGPITAATDYLSGIWDDVVSYFTKYQRDEEKAYYEELSRVQNNIKSNYGICIDVNLITATLIVNKTFDEVLIDGEEIISEINESGSSDSFKKMRKQVELLANMQLIRKNYGLDEGLKSNTGSYCVSEGGSYQQFENVTSQNIKNFKNDDISSDKVLDSSSYQLIAQHDDTDEWWTFLTKRSTEEKNYAYYLYRPYFDSDGNCDDDILGEEVEASIGDYNTMTESVYYWNLINSFIPGYYAEYLPEDPTEKAKKINEIAEDIYLLYDDLGPSQTCYVDSSYICRSDEGASFYGGGDKKLSLKEFTQNVSPIAIEEMTRTGIFSSITLSQAALESANGASGLSKNYSNYYGMTAGSCAPSQSPDVATGSVLQPGENGNKCTGNKFWNGSIVALCNSEGIDCQWYRIYDSFLNSTRDHSRLLSQGYGCNVYSSYSDQLDCLVSHGYATDPEYKEKITNLITSNNLSDYDIGSYSGTYQDIEGNGFVNNFCSGDGVITYAGEFTSWKQNDARWKTVKLGTSTVGKIGCAMTSVTIQILRSGVNNILGSNLNPGTFATTLTELGGFTPGGGIYWASAAKIAPNFKFVDSIRRYAPPSEIAQKVNQGYFVILNVKNGRHWVAVDRVEGDKIYMFDPGSGGNEVGNVYGLNSIVGYVYYRKG